MSPFSYRHPSPVPSPGYTKRDYSFRMASTGLRRMALVAG